MEERLTTREAANALGCDREKALALLHAAAIPHERIGPHHGPILWDGQAVKEFSRTLGRIRRPIAQELKVDGTGQ